MVLWISFLCCNTGCAILRAMNKSLFALVVVGILFTGGAYGQDFESSRDIYFGIRDARLQRAQIDRITNTVNNSINTPKASSVVPPFVPRPQYTGPMVTPGSPTPSVLLMYEIMRQRALRDQEGVAPDPIYYRPISPSVPCGPGCAPSAPPSLYERMKQNALELQWKLFPSTRPKPCRTC